MQTNRHLPKESHRIGQAFLQRCALCKQSFLTEKTRRASRYCIRCRHLQAFFPKKTIYAASSRSLRKKCAVKISPAHRRKRKFVFPTWKIFWSILHKPYSLCLQFVRLRFQKFLLRCLKPFWKLNRGQQRQEF